MTTRTGHTAVQVEGLTVVFGRFVAISDLTFSVRYGEVRGLIGPNGAGKTTLLDVLTGKSRPREGRVLLDGTINLEGLNEVARVQAGIGRKFQKPSVFEALTVHENLDLACRLHPRSLPREVLERDGRKRERIERLLDIIGLTALRGAPAGVLSHGQKQWLEIGMVVVQEPKLLLLDEPVAGMSDEETARTATLIKTLRSPDRSIVVVEHDMDFVEQVADDVTVLQDGRTLFEGSMVAARQDPRVIEGYIGR
ncbi:MAG: urea ABC transporter ATP-binding protein UrtD [Rhodospirillales bacterium 20-64-7]|nr:MAG: urea ABC transporter ATP-binding protein UrtD [Rhodospirillales bacterium 20-64-7]HQT77949.1 urea ABC transporter ATP-binding protein UrtD [Rhodopila sp.]